MSKSVLVPLLLVIVAVNSGCVVAGRTVVNEKGETVRQEPDRIMFTPIFVANPALVVGAPVGYVDEAPVVVYERPYRYYSPRVYYEPRYTHRMRTVYIGGHRHRHYRHCR